MRLRDHNQLTQPRVATQVLILQAILTVGATLATAAVGFVPALSVLIGGLACLVANTAAALWVFRDYQAPEAGQLLGRLYAAVVLKILLLIGSFAVALLMIDGLSLPALLAGYFFAQVLAPIIAAQPVSKARPAPAPKAASGPGARDSAPEQATS